MEEKKPMGSRIGENYNEIADNLKDILNVHKYRIYEAALDLFNVLPRIMQMTLVSDDSELRQQVLDTIKKMTPPPPPKTGGKK